MWHPVRSWHGDAEQKTQGTDGLIDHGAGGVLVVAEVEKIIAELLGGQQFGGAVEVSGAEGDAEDVGLDGSGRIVAELEILEEALP